jgi:hypothetical protein
MVVLRPISSEALNRTLTSLSERSAAIQANPAEILDPLNGEWGIIVRVNLQDQEVSGGGLGKWSSQSPEPVYPARRTR